MRTPAPRPAIAPPPPRRPAVLLIAYYFPPENTIGAARPGRFAKYLSRLGYPVWVIARRIEPHQPGHSVRKAPWRTVRIPNWNGQRGPFKRIGAALLWLVRRIAPYDDRLPWVPNAYAAASAVRARHPSHIVISTHPPLAAHLVALALKWRHGGPWIADFRDPLASGSYRPGKRAMLFDPLLEMLIIRCADVVIANTDAMHRRWCERYPRARHS